MFRAFQPITAPDSRQDSPLASEKPPRTWVRTTSSPVRPRPANSPPTQAAIYSLASATPPRKLPADDPNSATVDIAVGGFDGCIESGRADATTPKMPSRSTLLQSDVLDGEFAVTGGERPADPARRQRLPRAGRPVDLVRVGQRVERFLVDEELSSGAVSAKKSSHFVMGLNSLRSSGTTSVYVSDRHSDCGTRGRAWHRDTSHSKRGFRATRPGTTVGRPGTSPVTRCHVPDPGRDCRIESPTPVGTAAV